MKEKNPREQLIFVKVEKDQVAVPTVGLVSCVEEQTPQLLELSYGVVGCLRCLLSLKAPYAYAYMGLGYHRHVVCSITYRQRDLASHPTHELHNFLLLFR